MVSADSETVSSLDANERHSQACLIFLDECVRFIDILGLDEARVEVIDQRLAGFEASPGFRELAHRGAASGVVQEFARAMVLAAAAGFDMPAALA